ncbi:hypothetical protein [Parasphingopyxis sp.]|uniref:hypothetical protein n=1 Tax=Parasphingopyxis sp. TaxID=1920299 RepID=UPI00260D6F7D|nr:hypothetical protein [Parasphingopyxis sp.]
MVTRVVFAAALLCATSPLAAQQLPYILGNLTGIPEAAPPPTPLLPPTPEPEPRGPQIAYDVSSLLYNRTPDYLALGYDLEGLTGSVATHRVIRDYGPLDYEFEGLVRANDLRGGAATRAGD